MLILFQNNNIIKIKLYFHIEYSENAIKYSNFSLNSYTGHINPETIKNNQINTL